MAVRAGWSALVAGALIVALGLPTQVSAAPLPREDYPSWDEVLAARGDVAATASTIATLESLLGDLLAEAARLGDAAVARAAEADAARDALDAAIQRAATLDARADDAADRADASATGAAQVAAALYRSGGVDLTATLALTGDTDDLLDRLGTLDQVGGRLQGALARAQSDSNQAIALRDQAAVARAERDRLSGQADAARDAAQQAEAAADAAVATQQENLTLLYSQLATLKDTTLQLEQEYAVGQQQNNQPPPVTGGGGGGTTTPPPATDPGGFVVPGNEVNDVAGARIYAWAILAQNGFGPEQNDCLLWLWNRESGWRTNAYNASSGAYGIPQSLPGSKMASWGADWRTNYMTQINWGVTYIKVRYGSPCAAWAHSQETGWY